MELMSLLATLTLDKTDYDKGLEQAETDGKALPNPKAKAELDHTEYKTELDKTEEETNVFKEVVTGVWEGLKDAMVSIGVTGVITGVAAALKKGVSIAIESGKEIADNSKNLQISTRAYQEYEYVLGKSNIKVTELSKAMDGLGKILSGDVTEKQAKYLQALAEVGFTADETATKEQNLANMMNALFKYQGADKGAIIDWLFGKNQNWTGFFDQTEDNIEKLKKEASDMGLIMSDETIENAVKYKDSMEKLEQRLDAIKRSFGEGILPVITEAVDKLMMIVDFFTGSDKRTSTEKFGDVDSKYASKVSEIDATSLTAKTLASTLLGMGDTSKMSERDLAIWEGTAKSLIELVPTLSGVIDTENKTINETAEGIGELINQYSLLAKETAFETAKAEKQNILTNKENQIVEESVKVNEKLAEAEGNRQKAIDAFNATLQKYDQTAAGVSYDATIEDLNAAQEKVLNGLFGDEAGYAQAYQDFLKAREPLTAAIGEAQAAQTEIEKLTTDVEEGQAKYEAWVESEGAMYEGVSGAAATAVEDVNAIGDAINAVPTDPTITFHVQTEGAENQYAIGSSYIPYDQMALLHRGEKVLTATQVRNESGNASGNLEDRIEAAIRNGMANARVTALVSGDDLTDAVNMRTANELKGRRFYP